MPDKKLEKAFEKWVDETKKVDPYVAFLGGAKSERTRLLKEVKKRLTKRYVELGCAEDTYADMHVWLDKEIEKLKALREKKGEK